MYMMREEQIDSNVLLHRGACYQISFSSLTFSFFLFFSVYLCFSHTEMAAVSLAILKSLIKD